MTTAEANYYRWLRGRATDEIIRQANEVATSGGILPAGLEFTCQPYSHPHQFVTAEMVGPAVGLRGHPVSLAAAAPAGDSHIWVTEPIPAACGQVTIGGYDSETHRLDQSMIRGHDGPGRHAVWLETTLRHPWPTGTKITAETD